MRYVPGLMVCVVTALFLAVAPAARADDLNRDLLRKGMSLHDVIQTFGQPTQLEWVNVRGTPILVIFYPTDKSDAVFRATDNRTFLPLGFVAEGLTGWGRDFYEEIKSPGEPRAPQEPGDR